MLSLSRWRFVLLNNLKWWKYSWLVCISASRVDSHSSARFQFETGKEIVLPFFALCARLMRTRIDGLTIKLTCTVNREHSLLILREYWRRRIIHHNAFRWHLLIFILNNTAEIYTYCLDAISLLNLYASCCDVILWHRSFAAVEKLHSMTVSSVWRNRSKWPKLNWILRLSESFLYPKLQPF